MLWYEPQPSVSTQKLSALKAEQITTIDIIREPLIAIHLRKNETGWKIASEPLPGESPTNSPVDSQAVNPKMLQRILGLLSSQSYQRFSSQGQDLNAYGLEQSQTQIRFNELEIIFGKEEPIHSRRYVLIGQEIHLINNFIYYLLRSDIKQFIDEK